jgi:hypothetical protein
MQFNLRESSEFPKKKKHVQIAKGDHADGLPHAEADARGHAAVEASQAIGLVDVAEGLGDGQVLGPVGVVFHALHLDADDLDGLVPGGEATAETRGQDLLGGSEFLTRLAIVSAVLAGDTADGGLREAREAEARAPVGGLADGDGVDALVDAAQALTAVDVAEGLPGGRRGLALGGELVAGDLDGLHAGAEADGGVGLGDTTRHTAGNAGDEVGGAGGLGVVLGFGGDEEEDGALGRGLNPGPRNEALVV